MIATDKQTKFIRSLIEQKEVDPILLARLQDRLAANDLSSYEASKTIDWLMARPNKVGTPILPRLNELEGKVPEGKYALELADGAGNQVTFWEVDKPNERSAWHGRTFVSQYVAGQRGIAVKDIAKRQQVLELIAKNPAEALLRFGQLLGRCGHCGRELTNDESRQLGIGPVCRGKDGARWGL
jgi:hypothetical protein